MNKKLLSKLTVLGLSVGLLVGCSPEETVVEEPKEEVVQDNTQEQEEVAVDINILVEGEKQEDLSHNYDVSYGMTLLELMKEQYRLVEEDGFIKCIEGNEQDEDKGLYWVFDVNGEMGEVGAADYELQEGDVVDWKLMSFE